jgi:RING finger protein 113A
MDAQETQDTPRVFFKKPSAKAKSSFRKRAPTPPAATSSGSDYTSSDEEGGRVKRRRKNATITASSASTSTRRAGDQEDSTLDSKATSRLLAPSNDATKQSNWYDEGKDDDLSAKNLLGNTRARPDAAPDGTYKGAANYQSFIQKNPNATPKQVGPIKAPTNIRTITVTDFAPDVCKDYKQTGYCGFGDSCKYLHAREDYKHGWELDRDWEIGSKGKKSSGKVVASQNCGDKTAGDEDDDDDDDEFLESIPFACVICQKPYRNPIVTKCGHYFCESCALQRYRKSPACAICGAGTGGVFNGAKKLSQLLDKKRERARKRREKAIEAGEEPSDDEEEEDAGSDGSS